MAVVEHRDARSWTGGFEVHYQNSREMEKSLSEMRAGCLVQSLPVREAELARCRYSTRHLGDACSAVEGHHQVTGTGAVLEMESN